MSIETGGPAYPVVPINSSHWEGMTLRDYFAFGMMGEFFPIYPSETAAKACYQAADAMIKERNKG